MSDGEIEDSAGPDGRSGAPREALIWIVDPEDDPELLHHSSPWETAPHFRVGEIEFRCGFGASRGRLIWIRKGPAAIKSHLEVVERFRGENVVELGIGSGGSVALTALVGSPRKVVGVELKPGRVDALDELVAERGLDESVRLHFGVDQADRERLAAIVEAEFGDEPLGLVIDDASHRLDPTRASFETLFPRLRPGGLFVIEDWNHQHLLARALAAAMADPARGRIEGIDRAEVVKAPLTRLIIELVLVHAESDQVVRELRFDGHAVSVWRGSGDLDPSSFRLDDLITDDFGLLPVRSEGAGSGKRRLLPRWPRRPRGAVG